jgi:hypothetical protein
VVEAGREREQASRKGVALNLEHQVHQVINATHAAVGSVQREQLGERRSLCQQRRSQRHRRLAWAEPSPAAEQSGGIGRVSMHQRP